MALTEEQAKSHQDLIKHLASLPEADAASEIKIEAAFLASSNDDIAVAGIADKLKQEVDKYKEITAFDNVAGVFTNNSITSTTHFDGQGVAGQTFKVQQQAPLPKELGAIWPNASVHLDGHGNVTGGTVGVNHVGVPGTIGNIDYVEVANASLNIPVDGQLTAQNASFLVGAIVKEHGDANATNFTAAVITDGAGSEVSLYERQSKPLFVNPDVTVTGYQENVYGINSSQFTTAAGARTDLNLGGGNSAYVQGAAAVSDVTGSKPGIGGQMTVGVMWGGADKKSELAQNITAATGNQESARISSDGLRNGLDAAAKVYATLPAESQERLVSHIAQNLLPANTFNSVEDAKNYVSYELESRTQTQDQGQSPG